MAKKVKSKSASKPGKKLSYKTPAGSFKQEKPTTMTRGGKRAGTKPKRYTKTIKKLR